MSFVGLHFREGWKAPIPFYRFKCPVHGWVVDYKHGHAERLECPICAGKERL